MTAEVAVRRTGQLIGVQRRLAELGRLRYGEVAINKAGKPFPRSLTKWRLTSASRDLLTAAAELYGGKVRDWKDAPDAGMFELYTDSAELDVLLPPVYSAEDGTPTYPYMQAYELWDGPTLERRCDGETATVPKGRGLQTKPCLCDPEERACGVVTRVTVMLPRLPGLVVWRMDSHGWTVATQLPGTLDLLTRAAAQRRFVPATLRLESRSKKRRGDDGKVTTNRFVVPVLDLGVTPGELVRAIGADTWNVAALPAADKPQLTAGPDPTEGGHQRPSVAWGEETPLAATSPVPPAEEPPRPSHEPREGDRWMAAIHAIAAERGLDHEGIRVVAADLFDWSSPDHDDGEDQWPSLTTLNPLQRGKLRQALEAIEPSAGHADEAVAADAPPRLASTAAAIPSSTLVPAVDPSVGAVPGEADGPPGDERAAGERVAPGPATTVGGDQTPQADTLAVDNAVLTAAKAHGLVAADADIATAWRAIDAIATAALGPIPALPIDDADASPADLAAYVTYWTEIAARIATGEFDPVTSARPRTVTP